MTKSTTVPRGYFACITAFYCRDYTRVKKTDLRHPLRERQTLRQTEGENGDWTWRQRDEECQIADAPSCVAAMHPIYY